MTNNRANSRTPIDAKIDAIDLDNRETIGGLVNISAGGLMLVSESSIELNKLYRFEIQLPTTDTEQTTIELGADSLWTNQSDNGEYFWTGFQIIDISDANQEIIQQFTDGQ